MLSIDTTYTSAYNPTTNPITSAYTKLDTPCCTATAVLYKFTMCTQRHLYQFHIILSTNKTKTSTSTICLHEIPPYPVPAPRSRGATPTPATPSPVHTPTTPHPHATVLEDSTYTTHSTDTEIKSHYTINSFSHPTMSITVNIKSSGDNKYEVVIDPSITILELKQEIATKADVTPDRQRLIYSGKVLKDGDTVESYKIQSGHTIHLVKSAAARAAAASGDGATTTGTTTNNDAGGVPSSIASGQGSFNPLADLTGARYAGYTQLPSASMFGPDGGMNSGMPDPEQLSQMMSSPMFQEQMNAMLSNPQMLDFLIQQNPQLRAMGPQVREMMQSPFVRQMMSNPEMMRSMMEMGRNQMGGTGSAFPAPGNPTGESTDASTATSDTTTTPAANPFGSLFPGGVPPNPFLFGNPPPQDTPQDTRPPEERYEAQLRQLNDMGFFEFDRNIEALRRTGGSVQGAIEYLLNN